MKLPIYGRVERNAHSCQPYDLRRGFVEEDHYVETGDYFDPKNKADLIVEDMIEGEARRPPDFTATDSYPDETSRMTIEGRISGRHSKTRRVSDFTVRDTDGQANLEVVLRRDFEGDAGVVISNWGQRGGDAEVAFPLGSAKHMAEFNWGLARGGIHGCSQVDIHNERDFSRLKITTESGVQVFEVRDGLLYGE